MTRKENKALLTDYHSHILPGIDDGSRNVEMSLGMIEILSSQGVERIAATPHFYAHRENGVSAFLKKRDYAYQKLMQAQPAVSNIILGAEISIEQGISELADIEKLAYEGTNYILLEFPYTGFSDWMCDEIDNIAYNYDLVPVIAHLHRYLNDYSKSQIEKILSLNAVFQFNIEAFEFHFTRKFIKSIINSGSDFVFGSDCHNLKERKPNFDLLLKKAKPEWITQSNQLLDSDARQY